MTVPTFCVVKVEHRGNVSLAQKYLEDKVTGGGISNYSLCLVAYALSLANSPVAGAALNELSRRADHRGTDLYHLHQGGQV